MSQNRGEQMSREQMLHNRFSIIQINWRLPSRFFLLLFMFVVEQEQEWNKGNVGTWTGGQMEH